MSEQKFYDVIVYGSLKNGFENHSLMKTANAVFKGTAKSAEPNYLMCGVGNSFPGLINGDSYFSGEVYTVELEKIYLLLDFLEGHPTFYTRQIIDVKLDNTNEIIPAFVYILSDGYVKSYGSSLKHDSSRLSFKDNTYTWNNL